MIAAAQLLRSIGARELAQLATPAGAPLISPELLAALVGGTDTGTATPEQIAAASDAIAATIQPAVDVANASIGRISAGRLLSADEQTLLDAYACDIARYRLYDDASLPEDHPVRKRYEAAMRFIERVASGVEVIGKAPLGTPGLADSVAPDRVFTRDTLADY